MRLKIKSRVFTENFRQFKQFLSSGAKAQPFVDLFTTGTESEYRNFLQIRLDVFVLVFVCS